MGEHARRDRPIQANVGSVDPPAPDDDQVQRSVDIGDLFTDSLIREWLARSSAC